MQAATCVSRPVLRNSGVRCLTTIATSRLLAYPAAPAPLRNVASRGRKMTSRGGTVVVCGTLVVLGNALEFPDLPPQTLPVFMASSAVSFAATFGLAPQFKSAFQGTHDKRQLRTPAGCPARRLLHTAEPADLPASCRLPAQHHGSTVRAQRTKTGHPYTPLLRPVA